MSFKAIIVDFNGVYQMHMGEVNEPLQNYLKSLKPGVTVAMLSSVDKITLKVYEIMGSLQVFDNIFTIDDLPYAKPSPEAFTAAAKEIGIDVADCVMVDDSEANIAGAKKAGMKTVLYKDFDSFSKLIESV